jgi:hypothetical protein
MSDAGGTPPPNWYPDPEGDGLRWWDGTQWPEHRAPGQAGQQPAHQSQPVHQTWSQAGAMSTPATRVDPWLWQSIVATILCCLPAGIAGIVFAAQAQSAMGVGDMATAQNKARMAKNWTIAAIVLGLWWIPFLVIGGAMGILDM